MTLSELRKSLFGDKTLLTEEELRQLMQAHAEEEAKKEFFERDNIKNLPPEEQERLWKSAKRKVSARAAALSLGINTTYWFSVSRGKQHPGEKIARAYGLQKVNMYEVVDE